jgi:hypothetical protein
MALMFARVCNAPPAACAPASAVLVARGWLRGALNAARVAALAGFGRRG